MKKNKEPTHWLWKYVAAILLFAAAVNGAMYLPIPTLSTLTSGDWLGFWGSYLGGAIGCIPAIAALLHSQAEAKRLHEETAETHRLSIMPAFSVEMNLRHNFDAYTVCVALNPDGTLTVKSTDAAITARMFADTHGGTDKDYVCHNCELQNIGLGPALGLKLTLKSGLNEQAKRLIFDSYGAGKVVHILLCLPKRTSSTVVLTYSDFLGNEYSQSFSLAYTKSDDRYTVLPVSAPTLIKPE